MDNTKLSDYLESKQLLTKHDYKDETVYETDKFHISIMKKTEVFELSVYAEEPFSVISSPERKDYDEMVDFGIYIIEQILVTNEKPKVLSSYRVEFSSK